MIIQTFWRTSKQILSIFIQGKIMTKIVKVKTQYVENE